MIYLMIINIKTRVGPYDYSLQARTFEFNINDDVFVNNSWYFKNSLVRANYKNLEKIFLKI